MRERPPHSRALNTVMISSMSLARSSSDVLSSPRVEDDDLDALGFADGEHPFRAETQEAVLVRDDQPTNLAVDHGIKPPLEALLVIVHATAQVGGHLDG